MRKRTDDEFIETVKQALMPKLTRLIAYQVEHGRFFHVVRETAPRRFTTISIPYEELTQMTHSGVEFIPDMNQAFKIIEEGDPSQGIAICARGVDGCVFMGFLRPVKS